MLRADNRPVTIPTRLLGLGPCCRWPWLRGGGADWLGHAGGVRGGLAHRAQEQGARGGLHPGGHGWGALQPGGHSEGALEPGGQGAGAQGGGGPARGHATTHSSCNDEGQGWQGGFHVFFCFFLCFSHIGSIYTVTIQSEMWETYRKNTIHDYIT